MEAPRSDTGPHCGLEASRLLIDRQLAGLEADVAQEVGRAVAFAEAGTWEPVEDLEKDVYARAGQAARMPETPVPPPAR